MQVLFYQEMPCTEQCNACAGEPGDAAMYGKSWWGLRGCCGSVIVKLQGSGRGSGEGCAAVARGRRVYEHMAGWWRGRLRCREKGVGIDGRARHFCCGRRDGVDMLSMNWTLGVRARNARSTPPVSPDPVAIKPAAMTENIANMTKTQTNKNQKPERSMDQRSHDRKTPERHYTAMRGRLRPFWVKMDRAVPKSSVMEISRSRIRRQARPCIFVSNVDCMEVKYTPSSKALHGEFKGPSPPPYTYTKHQSRMSVPSRLAIQTSLQTTQS
jgi:hypothetical protein